MVIIDDHTSKLGSYIQNLLAGHDSYFDSMCLQTGFCLYPFASGLFLVRPCIPRGEYMNTRKFLSLMNLGCEMVSVFLFSILTNHNSGNAVSTGFGCVPVGRPRSNRPKTPRKVQWAAPVV